MQTVQLQVDDEIKAVADAIGGLISDIKAGKTVVQDLTDALMALVPAVSALQALPADIKKVDNQVYILKSLGDALEPKVA
jgi:hypothetical protein